MPKLFRFRLERLLEIRRILEETKRREFADANRAVEDQQQAILRLIVEEESTKVELRGLKSKELDLTAVRIREQYLNLLSRKITEAYRGLQTRQLHRSEKRRELVGAMQGVRVLERLRERRRGEYDVAIARDEQKFLDEVASRMVQEGSP